MSLWLRRQVTANYWINLKGLDKSNSTITKMFDDLWERVKEEKTSFGWRDIRIRTSLSSL